MVRILYRLTAWLLWLINALALRAFRIFHDYPFDPVEISVSFHAFGYGFWIAWPDDTFGSSQSFADVRQYLTETQVGMIFLTVGLIWMIAIILRRRKLRIVSAAVATFCYTYWAIMLGTANFPSVGWWTYGLFASMALWAVHRNYSRMISK
jgi:hypothetical protein